MMNLALMVRAFVLSSACHDPTSHENRYDSKYDSELQHSTHITGEHTIENKIRQGLAQ
jgi:hypothetical protein